MKKTKIVIALLVAIVMTLSMIPVAASAEEEIEVYLHASPDSQYPGEECRIVIDEITPEYNPEDLVDCTWEVRNNTGVIETGYTLEDGIISFDKYGSYEVFLKSFRTSDDPGTLHNVSECFPARIGVVASAQLSVENEKVCAGDMAKITVESICGEEPPVEEGLKYIWLVMDSNDEITPEQTDIPEYSFTSEDPEDYQVTLAYLDYYPKKSVDVDLDGGNVVNISFKDYRTVTFVPYPAAPLFFEKVILGEKAVKPADPVRDEFTFEGWFSDPDCEEPYDFSTPVTDDLTLYGAWRAGSITAEISSDKELYDLEEDITVTAKNPSTKYFIENYHWQITDGYDLVESPDGPSPSISFGVRRPGRYCVDLLNVKIDGGCPAEVKNSYTYFWVLDSNEEKLSAKVSADKSEANPGQKIKVKIDSISMKEPVKDTRWIVYRDGKQVEVISSEKAFLEYIPEMPGRYTFELSAVQRDMEDYYDALAVTGSSAEVNVVVEYKCISGAGAVIDVALGKDASFRSDADFSKFVRVDVDGKTVDPKYYIASSGSTLITLKADYLKTLANGKHTIDIVSVDGKASADFTIVNNAVPKTGDETAVMSYIAIMIIAAAVIVSVIVKRKKYSE